MGLARCPPHARATIPGPVAVRHGGMDRIWAAVVGWSPANCAVRQSPTPESRDSLCAPGCSLRAARHGAAIAREKSSPVMINKPVAAIAAVLSLVAALLAYDTQGFIRISAREDANGPKLRMLVMGSARPTVVFENGGGGSLELWGQVPARVSEFARVVAYDRAGDGLSDKGTTERNGRNIASELHAALRNAGIPPPYILVGHSLGGPYARVFAGIYPKEVAGMVLVDPTQEEMMDWNVENGFSRISERPEFISVTLGQLRDSVVPPGIPVSLIHVIKSWPHGPFQSRDIDAMVARVISRAPLRLKFHKEWIESIPEGRLISTDISSHAGINFEEPELVVDTIRKAVVEIRTRQ